MMAIRNRLHGITTPAAMLALLLLQACGSAPTEKPAPVEPIATEQPEIVEPVTNLALPASAYQAELAAAESALADRDWMSALTALSAMAKADLNADDTAMLQYMLARVDYLRGDHAAAHQRLASVGTNGLTPGVIYRMRNFQRHLLEIEGRYLESARLGTQVMAMAMTADKPAIKRSIWRDLERCSPAQLEQALASAEDATWRGWLALAHLDNTSTIALSAKLAGWQAEFPDHPAAQPLPGGLQYLLPPPPTPDTVALVLPLSGRLAPAGKAVREGYLASYFAARSAGEAPSQVIVIDSDRFGSASEAYNQAVAQGARLVIGPLSKSSTTELAILPQRPVPVIALNRIDEAANSAQTALVQLSLAPEDEARQLAETAFGQGARRALVLRPAGAWGDKIESALVSRWQSLGGSIAGNIRYASREEYSASVKAGLGIDASEQRRRDIRDMLASNVEFTPRRRQDIDAIFMLGRTPEEARALKPLLAFHYAGALPVYATSSVYGGRYDKRDRDLDGTRIVELPWLLGSNAQLKQALASSNSTQYRRLNALGADAYRLQSRFAQLQAGPDALIRGNTGLLSMNPRLQIERESQAAVFDGDQLKPL